MSSEAAAPGEAPSLRIRELVITNYRTFRERTVIPFANAGEAPDEIATFHGPNGSGKSTALVALELFFAWAVWCLAQPNSGWELLLGWGFPVQSPGIRGLREVRFEYRDRPSGVSGATEIEVRFAHSPPGALRLVLTPSGEQVRVRLGEVVDPSVGGLEGTFRKIRDESRDALRTLLETPLGSASRPIAILGARRVPSWVSPDQGTTLLPARIVNELFALRSSRRVEERERWRAYAAALAEFDTFRGKEIAVEHVDGVGVQLSVEDRGKSVLVFDELSSGEQQIVTLLATVFLAKSPIVAIEEPELSLDDENTKRFRALLEDLVASRVFEQVILESHVPAFDGPNVIRFERSDGNTAVTRKPTAPEARELEEAARKSGAEKRWVTKDGYTQLPENMLRDLSVGPGSHLWFIKGKGRWQAWPLRELEELLAEPAEDGDE